MASLDDFFKKDGRLVNLDWLDIDPKDYENLPFNDIPPYIAIPKLEEAWSNVEDTNLNLVPNSDLNFNYEKPDSKKDVEDLLAFTKKQMMSGKKGNSLVEILKERSTPELIKKAYSRLKELSLEQGLLGNVYIDPTVFARCEEGSNFVSKKTKTARFVKAMDKCSNCCFNKKGRCDVYKKNIASQINYDAEMLDFYSRHFSNLNGQKITLSSKEELQKQFLFEPKIETKVAEFKPNTTEAKEKSLEDLENQYDSQLQELKNEISKAKEFEVGKDVSSFLIKGYSSRSIKDYIKTRYSSEEFEKNKETFNSILAYQGSLGKVYIDADKLSISTASEIENFIREIPKIKYVVVNPNGKLGSKIEEVCKRHNKEVVPTVNDIPKQAFRNEFEGYPSNIKSKVASIFEVDHIRGLRLAFIQDELIKTNFKTPKIENFELTAGMSLTEHTPKIINDVYFSHNKVINALDKGYPLSSIVRTAKNLGISDEEISNNIKKAFENIKQVSKHQLDINFSIPENVKVVMSQKDVNAGLEKPLENLPEFNSSKASIDTSVKDFDLRESSLNTSDIKEAKQDIEIKELNKFNI